MSEDDYGIYFDDMDSPSDFESVTTVESIQHEQRPIEKSYLKQLSSDVVIGNILPYLLQKKTLATLATVSKHFNEVLFSPEAEHVWNDKQSTFHLCIDTYCTACLIKKLQKKGSHFGSTGFLKKFPISRLKLHCFVTDIPDCMLALSSRKYLKALDLTLTNKSNSPPLEDLLGMSSFYPIMEPSATGTINNEDLLFPELNELILDSSHLQHVNLAGRARLLDILGTNLESLTFSGLSPAGVFSILSSRCPSLKKLRVDRASSHQDMLGYKNILLEELELHRSNFLLHPKCLDSFPALKSLRYTPSFRCDSAQIEGIIAASPAVLRHLSLEIPSRSGNDVLNAVSRRLFLLESLSIQGSYECGSLTQEAVLKIGRKCLFLSSLEVTSTKSVSELQFDVSSFMTLATFPSLRKLRVKHDDLLTNSLHDLLNQSDSLKEIFLWERKKWISAAKWSEMQRKIDTLNIQFPLRKITLEAIG